MNIFNRLKTFISLFILIFLTSCQFLNQDVADFFRDYTETAAIEKIEFYNTVTIDSQNTPCIDSTSEQRIHLSLRNPQMYSSLKFTYEFNNSFISSFERSVPAAVTFVPLNSAYSEYDIVFSKDFLKAVDNGDVTNGTEIIKDISGTVRIVETNTMREFESYDISLRADSTPPEPVISLFQLSEDNGGKFILCLAFPKIEGTVHKNDTHKLYIGSNCWSFNGNFNGNGLTKISGSSGDFSNLYTGSNLHPLQENGYKFSDYEGNSDYQYLYFDTGIDFDPNELVYDVGFEDDHQLKKLTKISNKSEQLSPVTFDFGENDKLQADESGYVTTILHHNGLTTENTSAGGGITIHYTVYDSANNIIDSATGTDLSVAVKIPFGPNFKISAYATKPYYVSSASASVSSFKVARSPIYYVSDSGDNAGMGTKASPYRTIQKAIDEINNQIGIFGKIDSGYIINLLSDITPDTSETNTNLVNFAVTNNPTITIRGVNSNGSSTNRKIDAMGTDLSKKRIFNIDNNGIANGTTTINLENLTLTGGYAENNGTGLNVSVSSGKYAVVNLKNVVITGNTVTCSNDNSNGNYGGAGIYFSGGYDNNSKITLENCTITNNKALGTAVGGGILSKTGASGQANGTLTLKGSTVISNNSSESYGGGIYCTNTLNLESSTKIINNVANGDGAGLFVHGDANVTISGKINITENKKVDTINSTSVPSNVYLKQNAILNVSGSVSGSKIGFTTETAPTKGNSIPIATPSFTNPSNVLISDKDHGIKRNTMTDKIEATVDGGGIIPPGSPTNISITLDNNVIICGEETTIKIIIKKGTTEISLDNLNVELYVTNEPNSPIITTNTQTLVIPADKELTTEESYKINVTGTYNGTTVDGKNNVTVVDDELLSTLRVNPSYVPSSGDTINISSGKAISQIATWVNSGESLEGVEFKLENDVTLPENFTSIGNSEKPFIGTFDGNGKTITVKSFASGSTSLFGYLTPATKCEIKNLTLSGDLNITGNFYGFVNYCQNNVIIKNCVNKCNVTATGNIAGFTQAVNNDSYIENCRNEGNLTSTGGMAAGISISGGSGSYKLKKCSNAGKITGKSYVGGIMAQKAFVTNIMNCYNEGEITGESYVGGIAGSCYTYNTSTTKGITNCYNTGTVTAKQYAGGIVGSTYSTTGNYAYCAISNCVNYGTVTCTDNPSSAGGIIGCVHQIYQDEPSRITFAGNFYLEGSASSDIGEQSLVVDGNRKLTTSNIDSVLTDLNYWVTSSNSSYESALVSWKLDSNDRLILDISN